MFRRLLVGLLLGFVVGGLLAAGLIAGLKVSTFDGSAGAALAFAAAACVGVLTGLVTGKPIWAQGAKVEAGLKAFFGALLGAGAMFALRQWASGWALDLSALGAGGPGPVGDLPAASLPIIAAVLGALFGLDNTGDEPEASAATKRQRVRTDEVNGQTRAQSRPPLDAEEPDEQSANLASKRARQ